MTIAVIIFLALLLALMVWSFYFWRSKHERKWVYAALQELSIVMNLSGAEMQRLPAPALYGSYCSYPLVIEWSKADDGKRYRWLISAQLFKTVSERYYIQSDTVEGKLRKVIDLDLCESGDETFDRHCLVFSTSARTAAKVFNAYMRERIRKHFDGHFAVTVNGDHSVLELVLDRTAPMAYLASVCSVWTELLNLIESV